MIILTDSERAFADTAKGRAYVAAKRSRHNAGLAYDSFAVPWGPADDDAAIREGAKVHARTAVMDAVAAPTHAAAAAVRDTVRFLQY